MVRALFAAILLLAGCGGQQGTTPTPATTEPASSATLPSYPSPTATAVLDPECEAAFVAGLAARDTEPTTYLDPALFVCETVADFRAASRAHPDAIDSHLDAFLARRCTASEENLATPLCSEANPHD